MKTLTLRLTALEPLVLTDGSAESMAHTTLEYIPGNMLLGAMAAEWKKGHPGVIPDDDPSFRTLFLNGGVQWGHAYPLSGGCRCVPVPASFMQDKNRGGIPVCGAPENETYIINCLHDRPEKEQGDVPRKMKRASAAFMDPDTFRQPDIMTHWNMHVAIGEDRRNAEGQLFGFRSLAAGTAFRSDVLCRDSDMAKAAAALVKACGGRLRVGHGRSAGYGLVRVEVQDDVAGAEVPAVTGREFTVFLLSDYIPRSCRENPLEAFVRELSEHLGVCRIVEGKQFCAFRDIAGFNGFWRLPRPSCTAIKKGAAFVMQRESDSVQSLPESLGGRRQEGYGRILINPAFLKGYLVTPVFGGGLDKEGTAPFPSGSPLLTVWRRRALERESRERAVEFVYTVLWGFIRSASEPDRHPPSASQLGNIRRLVSERPALVREGATVRKPWKDAFDGMLQKTPGRQWKTASGLDPFNRDIYENLDVIMRKLLDPDAFRDLTRAHTATSSLPGGPMTPAEETLFHERFQRHALLGLISTWDREIKKLAALGGE